MFKVSDLSPNSSATMKDEGVARIKEMEAHYQALKDYMEDGLYNLLDKAEERSPLTETRKHLAAEKKRQNTHNCAQAVTCTYCDLVGLDGQTALDIAGAYGTGMGNMEGTCGALVGAGMIVGLVTKDRVKSRARMKEMMEKFQARCGATQCRLLKGIGTGKPLRDCPDCVADAAEFLEEYL